MSTFITTLRPTPFGFYDSDPIFQWDAERMVTFVMRALGEDILSVELTNKVIWMWFENATREFQGFIIEYQAKSNLASILGMPSGSLNLNNPFDPNNINLTNMYVHQNLEFVNSLADAYSEIIGLGGKQETYSGSITLELGRQDYNLNTELKNDSGDALYGLQPSGSVDKMTIHEIFHVSPMNYMFSGGSMSPGMLSNNLSSFAGQIGGGSMAFFQVLPVFDDLLKWGHLKMSDKVRRSHYTYKISGKMLRIFPVPTNLVEGVNNKLWIRVGYRQTALPGLENSLVVSGTRNLTNTPAGTQVLFGANNPANIPYGLITYKTLNQWARNWIAQYTLACCMEYVGNIRSKIKSIPAGDKEISMNGDDLVSRGREDKEKLLTGLKEKLESLTYDKLMEQEATRAENMIKQLNYIPLPPSCIIRIK